MTLCVGYSWPIGIQMGSLLYAPEIESLHKVVDMLLGWRMGVMLECLWDVMMVILWVIMFVELQLV